MFKQMRCDILVSWSAFKPFDLGGHKARFIESEELLWCTFFTKRFAANIWWGAGVGGNMFLEIAKKHFSNTYSSCHDQKQAWQCLHLPEKKSTIFSHRFLKPLENKKKVWYYIHIKNK